MPRISHRAMALIDDLVEKAVEWVDSQRDAHRASAFPLPEPERTLIAPFFTGKTLSGRSQHIPEIETPPSWGLSKRVTAGRSTSPRWPILPSTTPSFYRTPILRNRISSRCCSTKVCTWRSTSSLASRGSCGAISKDGCQTGWTILPSRWRATPTTWNGSSAWHPIGPFPSEERLP